MPDSPPADLPSTDLAPLELPATVRRRAATARRVVAFTGAGVSRESGLATFRGGEGGLWDRFRPEELATPEAFASHPERVWGWYAWRFRAAAAAEPNPGHHALVRLGEIFPQLTLVTQNVDGLHQRAGSRGVLEVHGTLRRARCHRCGTEREMAAAVEESPDEPPRCPCGGRFRPAVVWFGEPLPQDVLRRAAEAAGEADLFVAAGTSATVFPAAGLIDTAHRGGAVVIEVNPEPTAFSGLAELRIAAPSGEALPRLAAALAACRAG
ncbi:MAG TPA: NAD-dependent deacylase [Thermoanaerobaculia bacterium]|nr:NAD-dependent deacylase [Thermoanaerobaculia bacterium]